MPEIPFHIYESLKPLAIDLLYSFESTRLPYYAETNKVVEIIKILIKNNFQPMVSIQQKLSTAETIIKELKLMRNIQNKYIQALSERDQTRIDEYLEKKKMQERRVDDLLKQY